MQPKAILETALYTRDLAAARAFYGEVLGLPVIAEVSARHVFFRVGAGVLLVFDPEATEVPSHNPALPVPVHGARGPGHVCFRAETAAELDAWKVQLLAQGQTIEHEHDWPGGGRSIYLRDPAGNSVELAEARIWGL